MPLNGPQDSQGSEHVGLWRLSSYASVWRQDLPAGRRTRWGSSRCRQFGASRIKPSISLWLAGVIVGDMFKYQVVDAVTGDFLGEIDSHHELGLDEGIAHHDGRVFRICTITSIGATGNRLRLLEVIETVDSEWPARLDRPAS
jgi:hypothetical protein